jgi:peptidoglycan L-alanyl-D-glutamate endopeptidase CwlK
MQSRLSDPGLLAPAFRAKLEAVLSALRAVGHDPIVHETMRSQARAQQLVADGKSKAKGGLSMHCYGIAADVICGRHRWDCHKHKCDFFEAYGVTAEKHGLTWGGRWRTLVDKPHVQAVPVRLQNKVRALPDEHVETFVASFLAGLVR